MKYPAVIFHFCDRQVSCCDIFHKLLNVMFWNLVRPECRPTKNHWDDSLIERVNQRTVPTI